LPPEVAVENNPFVVAVADADVVQVAIEVPVVVDRRC
jgi:hypothetical protein